jgi:hypothetical protein
VRLKGLGKPKKSNDLIGIGTRDLLALDNNEKMNHE